MITLQQWHDADRYTASFEYHTSGAVRVYVGSQTDCAGLFRLSDYVVQSALSGPSYWLVPRQTPEVGR